MDVAQFRTNLIPSILVSIVTFTICVLFVESFTLAIVSSSCTCIASVKTHALQHVLTSQPWDPIISSCSDGGVFFSSDILLLS